MNDSVVIIPTYNEKENIADIIDAVFSLTHPFDVLVIDDKSPDGTSGIVKEVQSKSGYSDRLHLIERPGKSGLGTAYIEGFAFALAKGYEFICEMDADFSHNPADLIRLRNACVKDGYDVAIGSRYISGVNIVNWPLNRVLLSISASRYVRMITGMPIKDPTAGFVCYSKRVLQKIDLLKVKFIGYAFQIEMKHIAWKAKFKIIEIPIIFTDRVKGKSKMSTSIFKEAFLGVIGMRFSGQKDKLKE